MAGAKVDVQVINGELNGICARMSEVTRAMGPQVWQGGSAGNFTTDLQGHNRSLTQMMMRVMQAVAALNKLPMVIDVPAMPSVTPGGLGGIASVSPSGLQRLEAALRRAADALPGHASRIQSLLSQAGPNDVSTAQCKTTAAWCQEQARPMRTRIHYALASDNVNPGFGVMHPGLAQIPDVRQFGRSEMEQLARLQAEMYRKQIEDPTAASQGILADLGASLRENAKDANYLSTFFGNVPRGSVGKLGYRLHQQHKDGTVLNNADKKLLGDFGTALAGLSRKKDQSSKDAVWNALGPAGSDMPGQGLLVRYSEGKWGSVVLADLGKAALRWRQQYHSYRLSWREKAFREPQWFDNGMEGDGAWMSRWGLHVGDSSLTKQYDPALNVLSRIAKDGDAAAARLLAGDVLPTQLVTGDPRSSKMEFRQGPWIARLPGGTYASLLVAPDWLDSGSAAGGVIDLATQRGRGDDQQAADIARQVTWSVSRWNGFTREDTRKFFRENEVVAPDGIGSDGRRLDLGPEMKKDLLKVAIRYLPSFSASQADEGDPDASLLDRDPLTGQSNFRVSGWTAQQFLSTFATEEAERQKLLIAAQLYNRRLITQEMHGGNSDLTFATAMSRVGTLEGNVLHGLESGFVAQGTSEQEAFAAAVKDGENARALVNTVVGMAPGVASLPGGVLPDLLADTDTLMSKATREKIDSAQANTQTIAYNWGNGVRESLAVALHS
ncbi:MAG: hypothetical protein JWO67_7173, partial [Streptosporangiaceae bacterium]|nr:hypothetical protein [Streptosporangiaceae bacterium]